MLPADPHAPLIAETVRAEDYDRFLTAQFAPPDRRGDLLALYAFNIEIAKTRETVSEPIIGQMRLQWWRDRITAIYEGQGAPKGNPVAESLARVITTHDLTQAHFDALIDARARDMEDLGPANLDALESYAEGVSGRLVHLALEILADRSEAAIAAGRHAGIAWTLTGLLRSVPFHARAGRSYLPQDLMMQAGLTLHHLQAKHKPEIVAGVAKAVAGRAAAHLAEARKIAGAAGAKARPALLIATLAGHYLSRLKTAEYAVLDGHWNVGRPNVLRLVWAAWAGRL